jgi:hypothetical protein
MAKMTDMLAETAGSTRARKAPQAEPERAGRGHLIGSHQPYEVKRQFDMLCVELGKTKENLHAEALNYLFAKYGKPEICPIRQYERGRKEGQG